MSMPLHVVSVGALSAVGLDAASTCAAIRAGIKRFTPIAEPLLDHEEPPIAAQVAADPRLRSDERTWLLALAGRALLECVPPGRESGTALLWQVPEPSRAHPLCSGDDAELLASLHRTIGRRFAAGSRVLRGGSAALIEGLSLARELIASGEVERCVIGGADSLVREADLAALADTQRLLVPGRPEGIVVGEGAAFVCVERAEPGREQPTIVGLGLGFERNTVASGRLSVGEGLCRALEAALHDAQVAEAELEFVVHDQAGDRYGAWETAHAHARGYRTRRERLLKLWPTRSVGTLGAAGGALALLVAHDALAAGHAPGRLGALELRSEGELRGVALLDGRASSEGEP